MRLSLTLTGTSPLLMHNVQLGDPDNEYVKEIARLNALKSKITEEQRAERSRLKWLGGLYLNADKLPVLPAANVFRSLQQAAALTRNGKDIERGLSFEAPEALLQYPGPTDLEKLWGGGKSDWVDVRMAKINRSPVVAVRPFFSQWGAEFAVALDEDVMSLDDFSFIADKAGRMIHIGDYRRFFGAYAVGITEL